MSIIFQNHNSLLPTSIFIKNGHFRQPVILIFDSGIGGLSVYSKIRKILPYCHYIYVFDNEAFPYGEKSENFIIERVIKIIDAISRFNDIDLFIIACNTASITALSFLRAYFPFLFIGVVPAIKLASKLTRNGIIGLLATRVTISSKYTQNLISQFARNYQVLQLSAPEMVNIAENKLCSKIVSLQTLYKLFYPWLSMSQPPDTIILGCTHFTFLTKEIQVFFTNKIIFVDSCVVVARYVSWLLHHNIIAYDCHKQSRVKINKAYCLSVTSHSLSLKAVLASYGFLLLERLLL